MHALEQLTIVCSSDVHWMVRMDGMVVSMKNPLGNNNPLGTWYGRSLLAVSDDEAGNVVSVLVYKREIHSPRVRRKRDQEDDEGDDDTEWGT